MNRTDRRIEELMNRVGGTIDGTEKNHGQAARDAARSMAESYIMGNRMLLNEINGAAEYICHLADIIDRMETALHNAAIKANALDKLKEGLENVIEHGVKNASGDHSLTAEMLLITINNWEEPIGGNDDENL